MRELLSSKQDGLVYQWLNLKPVILSLPGMFGDFCFHRKVFAVSALEAVDV